MAKTLQIPLPKSWPEHVKSAMLHVISLAQYATAYTRGWAADSANARVRLKARAERLEQEVACLREEMRIKDARMASMTPHKRPHYAPTERLAILELRAARCWTLQQTADAFLVAPATIASWMKRVDDQPPDALLQMREPVNRFPDFVRQAIRDLKNLCPSMGKAKVAQTLARAGLHMGSTTVSRILKEAPKPPEDKSKSQSAKTKVKADEPDQVHHLDLTTVPIGAGLWATWTPFALPQRWPFCWYVAAVVDHYSRRVVAVGVFAKKPGCPTICTFLGKAFRERNPKHLICDRDSIFDCEAFRKWAKRKGIRIRYGAVGKHGSIAVIERFFRTLKTEFARKTTMPMRRCEFRRELVRYVVWFNEHRPHMTLSGCTPNEIYFGRKPANRRPRVEPRKRWPRRSKCAKPQTLIGGSPGDVVTLGVAFEHKRRHLPVVTLRRAA